MASMPQEQVMFNPLEEGFVESPYDQYRRLRAVDPVHRSEMLQGWVITRFDDVNAVLRDPSVSSDIDLATPTPLTRAEIGRRDGADRGGRTLVLMDDPEHARIRRLVARPFRPREVSDLAALVEGRVRGTLDRLAAERGPGRVEIDLIADFAYPLPVEIFCEILGVPDEDHPRFRHWTQCVARSLDPVIDAEERARLQDAVDEMQDYLADQLELKRDRPGDDMLSQLISAEVDGDRLSREDLLAQVMTLYVAGHEPTAGLLGNGMLALIRQRDQYERLLAEPALVGNGVSEMLRYDGPNQFVRRIATRDMVVGDSAIPSGAVIYVSTGSANRDPDRWGDTADDLIVERADAAQHLQFGAGIHACLGSHLARLQIETALRALFDRLRDVELAGEPEWSTRMVIRGLNRLPLTCSIRS